MKRYLTVDGVPFRDLPAAAMRATLREGYSKASFRADVLAGLVVGVVALPLSMALAIAVGVPPQLGLYTAIVAGLVVPLLGGSRMQVTGPTAAFVVILAPVYTRFGLGGLVTAGFLAGIILLGFAVARFGKLLQFIPHPVTTGFTAGIGVVIGTLQLRDFLGLRVEQMPEHYLARVAALVEALPTVNAGALAVGGATLAVLILFPRVTSKFPAPLVAIVAATLASVALHASLGDSFSVETIGSRFTITGGFPRPGLPWNFVAGGGTFAPWIEGDATHAGHLDFAVIQAIVRAAFAIAMLGSIESLLSAVVADGMSGHRHDPDAELFGLAIGNLLCPFFGAIACTGAIARTATNIRAGAKSPIACVVHSLFLLAVVLVLSPLLRFIPMAALAALLLLVAWRMLDTKHFLRITRLAPRSDVAVLFTCFGLTVVFDMVIGVTVGVMLAAVLFMKRMVEVSSSTLLAPGHERHSGLALPPHVALYEIAGPLFFGAAEKAMSQLKISGRGLLVVILDMELVSAMDSTGLVALESAVASINGSGALAILEGVQPQPAAVLQRAGVLAKPGQLAFRPDLAAALVLAADFAAPPPLATASS